MRLPERFRSWRINRDIRDLPFLSLFWCWPALILLVTSISYLAFLHPPVLRQEWVDFWRPWFDPWHHQNLTYFGVVLLMAYGLLCLHLYRLNVLNEAHKLGRLRFVVPLVLGSVALIWIVDTAAESLWLHITGQEIEHWYHEGWYIPVTEFSLAGDLFSGVIGAPLFEELAFRGLFLGCLLARGWKPLPAILLTSLVFALTHTQYILFGQVLIFVAGCVFGLLRVMSGGILIPILAHSLTNLVIILVEFATIEPDSVVY